jgi:plastocyanin
MNKALITVLVVIALAGGGWGIYHHGKVNQKTSTTSQSATNGNSSSASSSQAAATGSIDIKNMMFTPSQITVAKGGTVTWTNNDSVAHTVIDDLSNVGGPASGDIQPGSTYSFTFTKSGSFQYHCSIHPSMRGTIVVK